MRQVKWLGLSVILALFSGGCDLLTAIGMQFTEDFSLSLSSDGITSLTIDWKNGVVTFRVDETATQITAGGTKTVVAVHQSSAQVAIEQLEVTLVADEDNNARAILRCTRPGENALSYRADVEVVVPAGLILNIASINGAVTVGGNTAATPRRRADRRCVG